MAHVRSFKEMLLKFSLIPKSYLLSKFAITFMAAFGLSNAYAQSSDVHVKEKITNDVVTP
jgi:hypothetical protein